MQTALSNNKLIISLGCSPAKNLPSKAARKGTSVRSMTGCMWYMKSTGFSRPSWLRCMTVCENVHRTPLSIAAARTMRKPNRWNSALKYKGKKS